MAHDIKPERSELLIRTTKIVSAYVANNPVESGSVSDLIQAVYTKLGELTVEGGSATVSQTPAVPVKKSITDDYLVCLEDGKKLKTLKRHLMTSFGLTPADYRAKWGLGSDYPMVAPNYARQRRDLAMKIGLGRRIEEPVPAPSRAAKSTGKPKPKAKAA